MTYFLRNLCRNNSHIKHISLKGRKYVNPTDLSASEMQSLLMTAIELKTSIINCVEMQYSVRKNITFLLNAPCIRLQTCLFNTSELLKMSLNVLIDPQWETTYLYPQDVGKLLSTNTDIIFCRAQRQSKLEHFAKGSTVPVISISSCHFTLLQNLSDLLTLHQHFGSLEGLVIAWVGRACPLLNTYLIIAPRLGIEVKFLCHCGGPVSPSNLDSVYSQGTPFTEKIKECKKLEEVIQGASVIATSPHSETHLKLKLADLDKYADHKWVFMHTLPRSSYEVDDDVFDSKRNLLWKSFANTKWICAAIITRFLGLEEKAFLE